MAGEMATRNWRRWPVALACAVMLLAELGCRGLTGHSTDLTSPREPPVSIAHCARPKSGDTIVLTSFQATSPLPAAPAPDSGAPASKDSTAASSSPTADSRIRGTGDVGAIDELAYPPCESMPSNVVCPPRRFIDIYGPERACVSPHSPLCFGCDCERFLPTLWGDAKGIANWNNSLILLAAGGTAIAMREGDADREVREAIAREPLRWGGASQALGKLGNVEVQAPVLLGVYGLSLWTNDTRMHDVSTSLISATTITGLGTTALKLMTNTDRPSNTWNNGRYGFPSYHSASSFAIAAVLDEYYGPKAGLPAYGLAAAIAFSRLDEQDHDLSDVVFGGTLGFVVGKAVAGRHLCGNSKIQFAPYWHPLDGSPGIGCETRF